MILVPTTRTLRAASPTKRRMITSVITSRKRAMRARTMTSHLCRAQGPCPDKGVSFAQDLLCSLVPGLALTQGAEATTITMWLRITASQVHPPCAGMCTLLRVMVADVSTTLTRVILSLPPPPLQRKRKVSALTNRESHQQKIHVSQLMSLFQIEN